MTRDEILQFLNENPACMLATVDGKRPRVRGMFMYRADEKGVIFHTGSGKDVWKQIEKNPAVELCFNNMQKGIQVRVSGTAQQVHDMKLRDEIIAARPFLNAIIEAKGIEFMRVFRIADCSASVWTMQTNLEPTTWIKL